MILPDQSWAVYIGLSVIILVGLIIAVRQGLGLWKDTRTHPPADAKYASRTDVDRLSKALADLSARTDARIEAMAAHNSQSREKIYGRLNQLAEDSASTRQAVETISTRQLLFDQKFDRLLERLAHPSK